MIVAGGIFLAVLGWAFAFGITWGNFWVKIGCAVTAVCMYALICQRPNLNMRRQSILGGVVAAAVLYGIFLAGNTLSHIFFANSADNVEGIYQLGRGSNRWLVFVLLCFITGPGEEIFWRGFLQEKLMNAWGRCTGFAAACLIYSGVHIFSGNLMLMMAALVAGLYWGALYLWRRDLVLVIVSHSLWSAFIFAVVPVR
jgi:membrane protease YdiL (CAAX protease family)